MFGGLKPAVADHLLNNQNASDALDCKLQNGELTPFKNTTIVGAVRNTIKTLYRYNHSYWFEWDSDVDVVPTPVVSANNALARIYFTGDGAPRVTQSDYATVGVAPYPTTSFTIGVPAPTNKATLDIEVLEPAPASGQPATTRDTLDLQTRFYTYTFINIWGEESAPASPAGPIDVYDDSHVRVNVDITAEGSGYVPIEKVRIYRSNTGTGRTEFQLVTDIPYGTATYLDTKKTKQLELVLLESLTWARPSDGMQGLVALPNGALAGFEGREVHLSMMNMPYAWPVEFRLSLDDDIVGISVVGANIVALTKTVPYLITGSQPSTMEPYRLPFNQACVSKRSIADVGGVMVFASPDGLFGVESSGKMTNLTEGVMSREEWQQYDIYNIHAHGHDGKYYAFTDSQAFVFDIRSRDIMPLSFRAQAGYKDLFTDKLHIARDGALLEWEGATAPVRYSWRTKEFRNTERSLTCARVLADDYNDVVFKMFVDGVQVMTKTLSDRFGFRLPAVRGRVFYFELEGSSTVVSLVFGSSMKEIA